MQANKNKLGFNPLVNNLVASVTGRNDRKITNAGKVSFEKEMIKALVARIKNLQGIKSVTYRYPVEEIAEFDQMILDLQKALGGKRVSKNDVQRSAVNFFLEDWQKRGKNSLIFQLLLTLLGE